VRTQEREKDAQFIQATFLTVIATSTTPAFETTQSLNDYLVGQAPQQ
jgi:hypothetical protein